MPFRLRENERSGIFAGRVIMAAACGGFQKAGF